MTTRPVPKRADCHHHPIEPNRLVGESNHNGRRSSQRWKPEVRSRRVPFLHQVIRTLFAVVFGMNVAVADQLTELSVRDSGKSIAIGRGNTNVATYVYSDAVVLRPYFANVRTPSGVPATRKFPPDAERDLVDHPTMHPGIWIAFGDISGSDFWRNQGTVRHHRFIEPPAVTDGSVRFVQEKHYVDPSGRPVCKEIFHCRIGEATDGMLIELDSTFSSDQEFYFGDQEEMGLGIRVHSDIAEQRGGQITDANGRKGADQVWSQASLWCDYRGTVDNQRVGMSILCHPDNPRESWMHARDYGLIAANAFGLSAMGKGPQTKTVVPAGGSLRMRYGVLIYDGDPDIDAAHRKYITDSR